MCDQTRFNLTLARILHGGGYEALLVGHVYGYEAPKVSLQDSFHGARHKVAKMAVRAEGRLTDIQTGRISFHEYNVICRNLIC